MKPALQLRQSQQLVLTPQLQQSIRLLQLSTQEVNQEVARLLDENPLLERADEPAAIPSYTPGSSSSESDTGERTASSEDEVRPAGEDWDKEDWNEPSFSSVGGHDEDDDGHAELAAEMPSLREHLIEQLNLSQVAGRDRNIVGLLIDALDENGYLSQPLEEIAELLPAELDISLDDLETALAVLQHLDEPGIGARNLRECLALQLKALPNEVPGRDLALSLVTHHLDLLAARDYVKLKKLLRCDDQALRLAQALIVQLNPKPGEKFGSRAADHVIPDVLVEHHQGRWQARLNPEAMPRLRVNQVYASILQRRGESNAQQLATQLQEARWFIKNLQQRFETILRVAQAIVERQHRFLEHGDVGMRPLVLREIAERLGLHESTISRVTTQKFMRTPRGVYEFKYFFSSGLATDSGGSCSSTAIRALIKQMVGEEDGQEPLTDSRISEILAQQGIMVARRTVAKYRESLHILPVNLRRSL
jgi:RNA polymerase sigma-54 factor